MKPLEQVRGDLINKAEELTKEWVVSLNGLKHRTIIRITNAGLKDE